MTFLTHVDGLFVGDTFVHVDKEKMFVFIIIYQNIITCPAPEMTFQIPLFHPTLPNIYSTETRFYDPMDKIILFSLNVQFHHVTEENEHSMMTVKHWFSTRWPQDDLK